jgi:hypothetical protein
MMRVFFLAIFLFVPRLAQAHGFDPVLIDVRERAGGVFEAISSVDVVVESDRVRARGLGTREAIVRVTFLNGETTTGLLHSDQESVVLRAPTSIASYVRLGIFHLLTGIDHLMFVLALVILVKRRLLLTITAFTVAHSLTLALAVTGILVVPQRLTEALIALSILLLAVEIAKKRTLRMPGAAAFAFGLLHGLGFASAVDLPRGHLAPALLGFNVGVELGQIAFVAVVLVARRLLPRLPRALPAYALGAVAAAFTIDRVLDFWRPL